MIALFFILASTHLLPWHALPDRFSLLKIMQFPWRLLSCATAIIALFTSGMLAGMLQRKPAVVLSVAALCIATMYLPMQYVFTDRHTRLDNMGLWDDYLNNSNIRPDNFIYLKNNDFDHFANKNAAITLLGYTDGYPDLLVSTRGEQTVPLPYIMYAGYYLRVDGEETPALKLESGLVGVTLNEGEHRVSLLYRRDIVIAPMIFSLLSLVMLSVLLICRHRRYIQRLCRRNVFSRFETIPIRQRAETSTAGEERWDRALKPATLPKACPAQAAERNPD
ncbi:hypothetical protein ABK905_04510 [Acerihabitans sp. KWT182]|uniref:Uncharacterized protein n=1 Tax=Acerihabitans sp. KWT182 TaxID=3157919 RepID=A0AAU7QBM1_9GAMM